jgi:carboxyl-terminal processing protease
LVLAAFVGGVTAARPLTAGRFNPYQKLEVFTKALAYIENNYVEDIAESDLMYGAARGLTDVLDPHSRFMDPEEYDHFRKETESGEEKDGIGVDVERRKNRLVIVAPIEGSPAAKAGIEPGDVIKRVDGTDLTNLEFDDAVARIQGPRGSEVVLTVERRGRELTFRIQRGHFEVRSVEGKMLEDGIAYVKIRIFASDTDRLLGNLLDQLTAENKGSFRGLVLDLRRNPGGILDESVKVADRFLAEGLIVKTVGKGGRVLDEAKAHKGGTLLGFPMVALVDGGTASAAEIVAGALQDHGRAVVMGTQTFGKGSVQSVINIDGCGPKPCGMKLTIARYYTPSGRSIQVQGITPNLVVEATGPAGPREDDQGPREADLKRRLRNEQGEEPARRRRLEDFQLQTAIDNLRSWSLFSKQADAR